MIFSLGRPLARRVIMVGFQNAVGYKNPNSVTGCDNETYLIGFCLD
jgi:hypothetical protein